MKEPKTKTLQETLRRALTSDDIIALRQRNEERAAKARQELGERWTCHPSRRVQKNEYHSILSQQNRVL